MSTEEDGVTYAVVVNDEEQFSIWPHLSTPPAGWRAVEKTGTQKACLDYIEQVWTDMRPLSLRKRMEERAQRPEAFERVLASEETAASLVTLLSEGEYPLQFCARPEATVARLREAIDSGIVLIHFTGTLGGTELAVPLDRAACDLSTAQFDGARGEVRLAGPLMLDGEEVICHATIELGTLKGTGYLVKRSE